MSKRTRADSVTELDDDGNVVPSVPERLGSSAALDAGAQQPASVASASASAAAAAGAPPGRAGGQAAAAAAVLRFAQGAWRTLKFVVVHDPAARVKNAAPAAPAAQGAQAPHPLFDIKNGHFF